MNRFVAIVAAGFLCSLVGACGQRDTQPPPDPIVTACNGPTDCEANQVCTNGVCITPNCMKHSDCPAQQACVNGTCGAPPGCQSDSDCDGELICEANGVCGTAVECTTTEDCCPGGISGCPLLCSANKCIGNACTDGETGSCFNGCHEGVKTCDKGTWTACDAPALETEACDDDIDNDCDGLTDEECPDCQPGAMQNCSTLCGEGTQTCQSDALWGPCDAPVDCLCEPNTTTSTTCEKCGHMLGTCEGGIWSFGECTSQGFCEPGEIESAECNTNFCGSKSRTCTDECTWPTQYGECITPEGACKPGTEESKGCGLCGSQTRSCENTCQWGVWSECDENSGCSPSDPPQSKPCAKCGQQFSYCDGCKWGDFGICENQGVCEQGDFEEEPCSKCGTRKRFCTNACTWGDWGTCTGQGECELGEVKAIACGSSVGECEQGTQTQVCGAACNWQEPGPCTGGVSGQSENLFAGESVCGNGKDEDCNGQDFVYPDSYEPNGGCDECYYLGEDPVYGYGGDKAALKPTFDSTVDKVDCFYFKAVDNFSVVFFGETIKVKVSNQPQGYDVDILVYQGYDNCASNTSLVQSVLKDGPTEEVKWTEGINQDDAGFYYVLIKSYGTNYCYTPYTLEISGLN